ncbi:hypothetical protein ETH_00006335, partial [Eimeria tenella]
MSCCTCECAESREADTLVAREQQPAQPLQFLVAGKSIQHPQKALSRSINGDAFAMDHH